MKKIACFTISLFVGLFAHFAQSTESDYVAEWHGFLTQAVLYSPDNPYAGKDSTNGSLQFREAGLNGFIEYSPELRFAGQVISRQRDESDDGDLRVDFLLADYLFSSTRHYSIGARVGRVKNNMGFYNSSRDIPTARPGFVVPEPIYFDAFRDTLISTDGINVYGSYLFSGNLLNWDILAGRKKPQSEKLEYYLYDGRLNQGEFDDVPVYGFNLEFIPGVTPELKFGISILDLEIKLKNAQSDGQALVELMTIPPTEILNERARIVSGTDVEGLFIILSAQYSYRDWLFTAEYLNLDSHSEINFPNPVGTTEQDTTTEGYYGQVEWLPYSSLSLLVRYEELYLDDKNRTFSGSTADYNPYKGFGRGWTVGSKWRFRPDLNLSAQASFNEGTVWLPSYKGIEDEQLDKYWNYYVVSLNYQF